LSECVYAADTIVTLLLLLQKQNIFPKLSEAKDENLYNYSGVLEISVADPEKKGDGVYAYVSYKVNTKVEFFLHNPFCRTVSQSHVLFTSG